MGYTMLVICYVLFCMVALFGIFFYDEESPWISLVAIIGVFVLTIISLRSAGTSDYARARQSNQTLDLASKTVIYMREGLDAHSAQAVCELLLPVATADSVAITNREVVLGFAGIDQESHPPNSPIQTLSTYLTLEDGITRILETPTAIGFTQDARKLRAGVVVALVVNRHIVGTLKFYYCHPRNLGENQRAIAEGFAQLLSSQLSLSYLQQQTELTARMELKALQAQINPHFLFNTLNTIASVARTEPDKARTLLREFAVYYRRMLENSEDFIPFIKEIEQTERYLMFQQARFGEEALELTVDIEPGLERLQMPSFMLQPLVENAIGHGRRDDGTPLHIKIGAHRGPKGLYISVSDDGVGIEKERLDNILSGESKTGMGIALKNVNARLKAFFGMSAGLSVESEYGNGTTAYLNLGDLEVEDTIKIGEKEGALQEEALRETLLEAPEIHDLQDGS